MTDDNVTPLLSNRRRRRRETPEPVENGATRNWRDDLIMGPRGPKPIVANAITTFRTAPLWHGVLAYNDHAVTTVARAPPPWESERETWRQRSWSPRDDVLATNWLQHAGIDCGLQVTQQAIEAVAQDVRFHPIRDYINGLIWDGRQRIPRFASAYLGAPDTDYERAVVQAFLISAVARIMQPGCKADHAVVLEGPQGIGKSSALAALAGDWFTDELSDLGSKDAAMQARAAWIVEIAELDTMSRAEVERVKAFLTRTSDRFRPPFGSRVIESPRQNVFAGTTNGSTYLRDETGGRRFWPIRCGKIRLYALRGDRDQLWAEARALYDAGESWWPDAHTAQLAATEQAARLVDDPWDAAIAAFVRGQDEVAVPDILGGALFIEKARWSQSDQNRVARYLRANGWERFQARTGDTGDRPTKRAWKYRRVTSAQLPFALAKELA